MKEGRTWSPCYVTLPSGEVHEAAVIFWSRRPDGWWANVTWTIDMLTHGGCYHSSQLRPRVILRKPFDGR